MQETPERRVQSLGWEDPLEEEMATHSSILPGKSRRQRSLEGYSPRGHKESYATERLNSTGATRTHRHQGGNDGALDYLQWQLNPKLSTSNPCALWSPFTPISVESQALGLGHIFLLYLSFLLAALGTHRILVPRPGIELRPSAVKHRALTTRPPKKFLAETFLILSSMELLGCSVQGVGSVWTDRALAEKGNLIIPIIWGLYTSFPLKLHPDPGALEEFLTKWNRTE